MQKRYWQLDFFRAVAIISVFLYHNLILPADNSFLVLTNHFLKILWCGVDLFFVLSGFLITSILISEDGRKNGCMVFLYRRALRIFPLYYFWLIIYFLFISDLFSDPDSNGLQSVFVYFFTYTFNFYLLVTQVWPEPGHLNHLWSLAVEEQFYFISSLIFFLVSPRRILYALLIGILLAHLIKLSMYSVDYPWGVIYTQFFTRMDALCCGGLAAWLWKYKKNNRLVILSSGVCALLSLSLILVTVYWQQSTLLSNHVVTFCSIGFSWLFASIILLSLYLNNSTLRALLDNEFFRTIAKLSYGIYISHVIIMYLISETLTNLGQSNIVLELFLNLIFTLSISFLLYKLVEVPFLNLKDSISFRSQGTA